MQPGDSRSRLIPIAAGILLLMSAMAAAPAGPAIREIRNRAGEPTAVAGDVIELLGDNLAAETAEVSDWPLPLALAGTQVFCGDFPAPILAAAPDRIRIQLPWELAGLANVNLRVVKGGDSSQLFPVPLETFAPAILGADPPVLVPGQTATFRVIGLGPRSRNPVTGQRPTDEAPGASAIGFAISLGGTPAPPSADGLARGNVQEDAGVQTITVEVPLNAPAGSGIAARVRMGSTQSAGLPVSIEAAAGPLLLSPTSAAIKAGDKTQFTATLEGAPAANLQWSLVPQSVKAGKQDIYTGSVQNGLFLSASYLVPPGWVIVKATLPGRGYASALVEIGGRGQKFYRLQPEVPILSPGESVTFTLYAEDGSPVDDSSWYMMGEYYAWPTKTFTASGNFTGQDGYQFYAVARVRTSSSSSDPVASVIVTVNPGRPQVTGTSPAIAHVGEMLTIEGSGLSDAQSVVSFAGADGSRIRVSGSPLGIRVPHGAVSGPVWVELSRVDGTTFASPPYPLTIHPHLRLHAARQRVSSGESIPISATATDVAGEWPIQWRADFGSIDGNGIFTAPTVTETNFARIWGCLLESTECDSVVVEVQPFRLEPDPLILNPGETARLKAWQGGGEVAATWTALTSNVSVEPDGTVKAGAGPFDGGPAVVVASHSGVTRQLPISVRTFGSVAHAAETYDWVPYVVNNLRTGVPKAAFTSSVVTNGDWVYGFAHELGPGNYEGNAWIDVYHLDERRNPVWVESVEAPRSPGRNGELYREGDTLWAFAAESGSDFRHKLLLEFDITGGLPVLKSRAVFDGSPAFYRRQGLEFTVQLVTGTFGPVNLRITDYSTGASRTLRLDYQPAASISTADVTGTSKWAAVTFQCGGATGQTEETVVFDISGERGVPIAYLAAGGFGQPLTTLEDLLIVGSEVFRVSDRRVDLVATLPMYFVADSDPTTHRLLMSPFGSFQAEGMRVVDLSDPANPRISAPMISSSQDAHGVLGPDYVATRDNPQNISIMPIAWTETIHQLDVFPGSTWMNDLRVRDGYLYWTGPGWGAMGRSRTEGILEVVDVSRWPSRVVASLDRPGDQSGWAIELNGPYAYVGTDTELNVYDVSSPVSPVLVTTVPAPAISMALLGNVLYVGSNSGKQYLLLVYDVSDPAHPVLVNSMPLADFAYSIAARPGWMALALGKKGLAIYSTQSPMTPVLASSRSEMCWGVKANANLLYAALDFSGLGILDLSVLNDPQVLSVTSMAAGDELLDDLYPYAMGLSYDDRGIVWVTTSKDGRVFALDVRQPRSPRHIAAIATEVGGYLTAATFSWNGVLFIAGNNAAYETSIPQNTGLYRVPQPWDAQVLPSRLMAAQPGVNSIGGPANESLKARILHGLDPGTRPATPRVLPMRPYRAERPRPGEASTPQSK